MPSKFAVFFRLLFLPPLEPELHESKQINCYPGCVMGIHVACSCMCVLPDMSKLAIKRVLRKGKKSQKKNEKNIYLIPRAHSLNECVATL